MKQPKPADELEISEHSTPHYWMDDAEVEEFGFEYSNRGPEDWISSGPLGDATGPGRQFSSWEVAEVWARGFYGARFRGRVQEAQEGTRWAFWVHGRK